MKGKYLRVNVRIEKEFYISPHEKQSPFSICQQVNENINGWDWRDSSIRIIKDKYVDWKEAQYENILAPSEGWGIISKREF